MKRTRNAQTILLNIAAWIGSMFVIIPLALIVLNAFKGNNETLTMTMQLPKTWNWENFRVVFEKGKLGRSFLNSFLYSCVSTFLTVFLGGMSAYVFSRRRSKKFSMVYMYIVLGMVIPVNYVSLMKVMQMTGLNNTQHGIILLYTAMQTPFTVFLYYGFVSKIPVELDEAAVIDGCGPWQLYFKVILPLLKPAAVTSGVLCFLNTWNEFIMPLYFLNSSSKWPVTLSVYNFFGQYEMSWNLICADVLMTCLPVVIVYLLGQKYIVGGQTAGAVKG